MDYVRKIYSGRVGRKSYILGSLLLGLYFIIAITVLAIGLALFGSHSFILVLLVYVFLIILHQFYSISLAVRRLHDLDKRNWYFLLLFIPLINIYWTLVLIFKKGEEGENKYGTVNLDAKILKTVFKLV